jgi:hypothetical protein
MKTIRSTRYRKFRIPNSVAILAALMLTISALAGFGVAPEPMSPFSARVAQADISEADQPDMTASAASQVKRKKGFKVNLLLFRHN